MRRSLTLLALTLCATTALGHVEIAAVQHPTIGKMLVGKVSEEIAPGDYEVLLKSLRDHPGTFARKVILLDTIGGSAAEAMRMGRLLRETGFDTLVPSTGVCQGSCIYLLAAGHKRTVRGHVGLHRPYFPAGDSAQAQSTPSALRQNPVTYLRDMGMAPNLAPDMQAIPPQRMRVLTPQELARYRLN
ncbi:hypothetical protein [Pseudomonas sp. Marseille-Q8238]